MKKNPLGLFAGFGIELEYMITDSESLAVAPVCDRLLASVDGSISLEKDMGPAAWSNELVLHVLEMKTNGPAKTLSGLGRMFLKNVRRANELLAPLGCRLMPGAAHPFMDPDRETFLWPHEQNEIYSAYNRIFGCRGHGWSNLQSTHINLPFADDKEFGRLHAAIRLALPILPALCASSPILSGRVTGFADARMEAYRHNADRIPSIAGGIIPERAFTRRAYREKILSPMYRDIAPFDPEEVLRDEWLNSRGAIARFSRGTIEIRVLDIQENPFADLALAALIISLLQRLAAEETCSYGEQKKREVGPLAEIFLACIREGEKAVIRDQSYLACLGVERKGPISAGEAWQEIAASSAKELSADPDWARPIETVLKKGSLATRILAATGPEPSREKLREIYGELCGCLAEGRMFLG